jgi:hypothetical protein
MEPYPPRTGHHTALISLTGKCDDEEEVKAFLIDQIKQLSNGKGETFYHKGPNKLIKLNPGVLTNGVDRPERSKMYSVGNGPRNSSVCWGYAAHVDPETK